MTNKRVFLINMKQVRTYNNEIDVTGKDVTSCYFTDAAEIDYVCDVTSVDQCSYPWPSSSVKAEIKVISSASSVFLVHKLGCDK